MPKNSKTIMTSQRFDIITHTMPCGKRFQGNERQVDIKTRQHLRVCEDQKCKKSNLKPGSVIYTDHYIHHDR